MVSTKEDYQKKYSDYNSVKQMFDSKIVHFFSSVAHVWVPGAKTTGPIVKMFGFS
jgi:phosphoribosyl-AMP cyclohydrolase